MSQPYALFHDHRDGKVYRVSADGQSKCQVAGAVVIVDQLNLENQGFDGDIIEAPAGALQAWLDTVPRSG